MAKHTEGPWSFESGDRYVRDPQTGGAIARVCEDDGHVSNPTQQPVTANGRLIASAPDLFAALQDLLTFDRVTRPAFRTMPVGAPNSTARIDQDKLIALEDAALAALAKASA
jgi:hypothetical protein